ncbi:hypothetical protein BRADI_5g04622v3 [Brachypodium distachyon]|uniref:Exocyst subunit Exo70 family protein n=1 Tax=Brachypodium distachyon TaxID=15368 RepID=A0A0Q3H1P7_BRADI|nr:hypothetical protein BRADI_5g04622v3 [Brachypodium distachyon]
MSDIRFGADGFDGSSSSSPSSVSGPSDSDASTDEYCPDDPREFRRHVSSLPEFEVSDPSAFRSTSPSSNCVLADVDKHLERMLLLLPAFSSPPDAATRADALRQWLTGFDVGWVLDMGSIDDVVVPRREVGRRVRAWVQALGTMERVFRRRYREARSPANDAAAAQLAALGELASQSAGAMLVLAGAVAAPLGNCSPSRLLAALDVYVPLSEAYPCLARTFCWGPSHPVTAASDAALVGLVAACMTSGPRPCAPTTTLGGACRRAARCTPASPSGWATSSSTMTTTTCQLRSAEESSNMLAFPGLRQVFMLNNTSAMVSRAVRSDLSLLLPPGWVRAREQPMEGYIKSYVQASWAPVLDDKRGAAFNVVLRRRNLLSAFYSALENACSMQRGWKNSVGECRAGILPVLDDHPEVEVPAGRTTEELEHRLSELFEG